MMSQCARVCKPTEVSESINNKQATKHYAKEQQQI